MEDRPPAIAAQSPRQRVARSHRFGCMRVRRVLI